MRISVIGLGRVGASLTARLLGDEKRGLRINVMDPDPEIDGAFDDLAHGTPLTPHELIKNSKSDFREADVIFFCAGKLSRRGASRLSVRKINVDLAREIFSGVRFKNAPFIVAISNPVDVVTYHIAKLGRTETNRVLGTGTLLDSSRLRIYLAQEFKADLSDVEGYVLGEHGTSMVPVFSCSRIAGKKLPSSASAKRKMEKCTHLVRTAATRIRMTQPATRWGVSECGFDIYKAIAGDRKFHAPISIKPNSYFADICGSQEICLGLPAHLSPNGYQVDDKFLLSELEEELLNSSARVLLRHL